MVKVMSEERRERMQALREQTNEGLVAALEVVLALIDSYTEARDRGVKEADKYLRSARKALLKTLGEK